MVVDNGKLTLNISPGHLSGYWTQYPLCGVVLVKTPSLLLLFIAGVNFAVRLIVTLWANALSTNMTIPRM
ncbi:hypothetical protein QZL56_17130 [Providencia stuartii]|nr:hypothetical protein [Providencia stuartii]MDN7224972.1 hypothetical protein [Providencia stuartii]MDQ5992327.1 hypothetical protein [Providencia stuartii]